MSLFNAMLVSLRIKNLALVDDLTLEGAPGFIAITGETGTGKSILIGALNLLLGERADRSLIRSGQEQCLVEALLDVNPMQPEFHALLAERGIEPCESGQLLLKRSFTTSGTNRQFVNGSPTTLQTLAEIGHWLVDLHGPHEHQSLLSPARQLDILDAYGNLEDLRHQFACTVAEGRRLMTEKEALIIDETSYARQLDLLRHQVQEIETAQLQPDSDEALTADYQRAANAARLLELAQSALSQIGDAEPDLLTQNGILGRALQELQHLDSTTDNLTELQTQVAALLQDLQQELRHYVDRIELDPERLQQLEHRLNLLQTLKRKYGPTTESILDFARSARLRLEQLESRDARLQDLQTQLHDVQEHLITQGQQLTRQRKKTLPRLSNAVTQQLQSLGLKHSQLNISLQSEPALRTPLERLPNKTGYDRIEFEFSPNPGEPPRPLRSIASSGEIARVMLAIKTVLAAQDRIPVLIFDEVDANVGGEIAHDVGKKMRRLGEHRQVLCITHLAPVAARAVTHWVVSKSVRSGRTHTQVHVVTGQDRIAELARMLGGQSASARQLATSLLELSCHPHD